MEESYVSLTDRITNIFNSFAAWLDGNLVNIFYVVLIFVIAMVAAKILRRLVSKLAYKMVREDMYPTKTDRERRVRTLNSIASAIVSFVVWAVASLMILNAIGVNTAPLLASAGILSVALGFGAQSLVKDFMTGMFIIAENQYRVGDYVEIQNVKGTVRAVTMRTTVIKDDDGSIFHVPNGSIIVTGNHTMGNNRVSIELSASTDTDLNKLRTIIDKIGTEQAKSTDMKELIIEPIHFRRVNDIKSGTVIIRLSGKVHAGKQGEVRSDYLTRLQNQLVKEKIALK